MGEIKVEIGDAELIVSYEETDETIIPNDVQLHKRNERLEFLKSIKRKKHVRNLKSSMRKKPAKKPAKMGRTPKSIPTHCVNGHEFTDKTLFYDSKNRRRCRSCYKDAYRRSHPIEMVKSRKRDKCMRGHELLGDNLVKSGSGTRCGECVRIRNAARRLKKSTP